LEAARRRSRTRRRQEHPPQTSSSEISTHLSQSLLAFHQICPIKSSVTKVPEPPRRAQEGGPFWKALERTHQGLQQQGLSSPSAIGGRASVSAAGGGWGVLEGGVGRVALAPPAPISIPLGWPHSALAARGAQPSPTAHCLREQRAPPVQSTHLQRANAYCGSCLWPGGTGTSHIDAAHSCTHTVDFALLPTSTSVDRPPLCFHPCLG